MDNLIDELTAATREVFSTMVFHEVQALSPIVGDDVPRPRASVVGTVAFAGKTCGLVVFYSTMDAARIITASMLGIEPDSVRDEVADAIGEVTNLIAGSFRTRMAHVAGETWAISVPAVTIGRDCHATHGRDAERVLCPFRMNEAEIVVELIVTPRAVQ